MNTIEIDQEVLDLLKSKADPFVDTPNSVLRRLLGLEKSNTINKQFSQPMVTDNTDNYVKDIIRHHFKFDGKLSKVGRYRFMFDLGNKLAYFQNYGKPTINLWYRITSSAIDDLKHKNAVIVFTYPVGRFFYIVEVSELIKRINNSKWASTNIEVNIDPDSNYWRELDWHLVRHTLP